MEASGTPADGAGLGSASPSPPSANRRTVGRVADRTPAVLAPDAASVDQGPGVSKATSNE